MAKTLSALLAKLVKFVKATLPFYQIQHHPLSEEEDDDNLLWTHLARDVDRNAIIQCIPPQNHPGQSLPICGTKKLILTIIVAFIFAIRLALNFLILDCPLVISLVHERALQHRNGLVLTC